MTMRRILLWGIPFVFVGSLIASAVIQSQEQNYQALKHRWTTYLGEYRTSSLCSAGNPGDITLGSDGRIWVAGACAGLSGLHVFDGTEWTSYDRDYTDLAINSLGQVWAVDFHGEGLDFFDGQQWRTYDISDLGFPIEEGWHIKQVEVDSNGRLWISAYSGYKSQSGILMLQDDVVMTFARRNLEWPSDVVHDLAADNHGGIWAAIYDVGLGHLEGETWELIPDQGRDLRHIVGIAFDQQGRVWVATRCSGVMTYEGTTWTTVFEGDADSYCVTRGQAIDGIAVDRQGRVWTWDSDRVQVLDGSAWIVFTSENSDLLPNSIVFGLAVDALDQVWIGSGDSVSMIPFEQTRPIPQEMVNAHRQRLILEERIRGWNWFLPSILTVMWLVTYFNMLPGVLIGLGLGLLSLAPFGPLMLHIGWTGSTLIVNPGVVGTFGGMLGGIVGGRIDKKRGAQGLTRRAVGLAIAGWIVGFVPWLWLVIVFATD